MYKGKKKSIKLPVKPIEIDTLKMTNMDSRLEDTESNRNSVIAY